MRVTPRYISARSPVHGVFRRRDDGTEIDTLIHRAGALNAADALTVASAIITAQGMGWLTESLVPIAAIASACEPAQAVIWGNAVGCENTIDSNQPVWADAVVWNAVVWGRAVVWGNGADGRAVVWGKSEDLTTTNIVWVQPIFQR
jgi:hypothetical protein